MAQNWLMMEKCCSKTGQCRVRAVLGQGSGWQLVVIAAGRDGSWKWMAAGRDGHWLG